VQFDILDSTLSEYSAFLLFNNYDMVVYDPAQNTLANLSADTEYNVKMAVDLANDQITWYLDDTPLYTGNFFDGGSTDQRLFSVRWSSVLADFDIDDFQITLGNLSANATLPEVEVEYTYNPDLFCAINWTSNVTGNRFVLQNCIDRGYNVEGNLVGLCPVRACLSDTASALFSSITGNLFTAIIVAIVIILIAPLLIGFAKRRR
jgi:hypothetical protein